MTQAYPLAWPDGWPRTKADRRADGSYKFVKKDHSARYGSRSISLSEAVRGVLAELDALGARHVVISTNIALRQDGLPRSGQRTPEDPGVALYFELDGSPKTMARDTFSKPEHNIRSLALAIDGMRQLQRHGGGVMIEKAFAGFDALPAPDHLPPEAKARQWDEVLGVSKFSRLDVVKRAYHTAALKTHPDQGGSTEAFREVQEAWAQAQKALR